MDLIDEISKKILYILSELKIKISKFIEIYKINNFDINKTLDYFVNFNPKQYELLNCNNITNKNIKNINYINNTDHDDQFTKLIDYLKDKEIRVLNISSVFYPENLKQIYLPPPILFYKGDKILNSKFNIAVVGTRKCTKYGKDVAEYLSRELSKIGITIVSGLALGIDYYAHTAALKEAGGSIGIMGCGIDLIYPPENDRLYKEILNNGSLVSEFFPGTPPLKTNFPLRNRIISGISTGVVVIEANEKSGALLTSEFALSQNREVFAIPGSIFSPESRGCHSLIKNGAKLVENIDDIIEEINLFYHKDLQKNFTFKTINNNVMNRKASNNSTIDSCSLNEDQKNIVNYLGFKPKSIEEIKNHTNFDTKKVLSILTELELKNLIKEKNSGMYILL